jgi:hypothetical protein
MMFMMPMPPTSNEIAGDAGEQRSHGLVGRGGGGFREFKLATDGEVGFATAAALRAKRRSSTPA